MTARLAESRIRAGRWEGLLSAEGQDAGDPAPQIEIVHPERSLEGVTVVPAKGGGWMVSVAIPAELLSDGVQTFVVREAATTEQIGRFTILAGAVLEDDIRAEVELLRAELDLLKKAFRRHCAQTGG